MRIVGSSSFCAVVSRLLSLCSFCRKGLKLVSCSSLVAVEKFVVVSVVVVRRRPNSWTSVATHSGSKALVH